MGLPWQQTKDISFKLSLEKVAYTQLKVNKSISYENQLIGDVLLLYQYLSMWINFP